MAVTINVHHALVLVMEAAETAIAGRHLVKTRVMRHVVHVPVVQEIAQIHVIHIVRHHV